MKIKIDNVSMVYPNNKQALRNINIHLDNPNMIGLLGPNGAGKSTLMKLLTGALIATDGNILVNDTPILKYEKTLRSKLGYLPQSFGLYDELSVYQFLDYMASLKAIKNRKAAIAKVIQMTNLEEKSKARIRSLSGGQRQRVGIAQALLGNPEFIILDEPTVGLDPKERIQFRNVFSDMAQDKLVLLSTHIIEDIQAICNQIIVINGGKILFTGTPEELIKKAKGHVCFFHDSKLREKVLEITSQINTENGITYRGIVDKLPANATETEPSLEDAYMYLMHKEVV